jgi:Fe-S-cluster containining protein
MKSAKSIDVRLEALEQSLAGGLRFSNNLGASVQQELREQRALLYAMAELLVGKGALHMHEVEARKQQLATAMDQSENTRPRLHLVETPDKYAVTDTPVIDCEARYPLCHGSCCKLWFSLSVQDLDEGRVKWNYAQPYSIAQGADGRCVHQERATFHCGVYENRPHVCRTYDCSKDKRIWTDFDARIPHPSLSDPNWPRVASEANRETEETAALPAASADAPETV